MSLVVAEIHGEAISLVADTKVTRPSDDHRTRHVFENVFPKVLLLRPDLCVGLAGNDPERVATALVEGRDLPTAGLIELGSSLPFASFVVAELLPSPRLVTIAAGMVEDRTDLGRAWVGDATAYNVFQERYTNDWCNVPDIPGFRVDVPFRLMASMQWLLSFARVPSVGGYLTRVGGSDASFRYVPDQMVIGPEEMRGLVSLQPSGAAQLQLMPVVGGDQSAFELRCAAGIPPTFGALAYLAVPPGVGVLFCHERPQVPVPIRANSLTELIDIADREYGQRLRSG